MPRPTHRPSRRRCAFLTTDDLSEFVTYDHLAVPPLVARGWEVDAVPWRAGADWGSYDLVVIRSPWDYQDDPEAFLRVLAEVDAASRLENSLDVVRWNLDKGYLAALAEAGVPVVPGLSRDGLRADGVGALFSELGTDEIVVKPTVSANADGTFRLHRDRPEGWPAAVAALAHRPLLAQPFVPAVVREGEYSLFTFGGTFSHAIVKTPAAGDFRVQEEHGGRIRAVEPPAEMVAAADRALAAATALVDSPVLYARTDLVRHAGAWRVMELELIEPSLYFPFGEGSAERFAAAVDALVPR